MPLGIGQGVIPGLVHGRAVFDPGNLKRTKFPGMSGLGFYLYIAVFFSFSLFPLLLWAPLWFLVDGFDKNRKVLWTRLVRPLIGVGLGFLHIRCNLRIRAQLQHSHSLHSYPVLAPVREPFRIHFYLFIGDDVRQQYGTGGLVEFPLDPYRQCPDWFCRSYSPSSIVRNAWMYF